MCWSGLCSIVQFWNVQFWNVQFRGDQVGGLLRGSGCGDDIEYGEGGFETHGGRGFWVLEDMKEGFHGNLAEQLEVVAPVGGLIQLRGLPGVAELG